jgi:hypothetical protein
LAYGYLGAAAISILFMRLTTFLLGICLSTAAGQALAQTKEQVKAKIASNICDCLEKKAAEKPFDKLTKEEATAVGLPCFTQAAAKEVTGIEHAYGSKALTDNELMRQIGRDAALVGVQNCPLFMQLSLAMAKEPGGYGATGVTGQVTGRLGDLHGTGIALLDIDLNDKEQTQFAWLQHLQSGDELLAQLPKLKGQRVRVSWQEVEVLDPSTNSYHKVRRLTSIEKQP